MRAQPLPIIGGFYADESRPWSMQDICNWLPVAAESEGTRTPTMAKTPPGLSPFARVSGEPVRGVYNAEGRLFAVMGNTLYQITPTTAIELGSISGTGRVRFAHNQITGGNEVLVVNGSAGWVWNTVTSTLTLITDTGYPGAINAVFIDGYLIQIEPARRYAFHSDLSDALSYNTLDRFTSEVSPDLLVSMAVSNNELLLFSETTTEFFENTGATQQPFRSKRISFQKGCAGRYTVATMDNTVFWLGDDGVFYLLDGYSPKRISTRPIEQAIRNLNWAQAFAFVWEDSGHSVCYWTFPDGLTFGYDASQQKWHRRASYGFDRWRVNDMAYWQGRWIAGDFQKGRLWWLDWSYPLEHDQEFISEITSPVIHDNQSSVLMPRLELVMDTGQILVEARSFEVDVAALSITGDVPDGFVGAPVSGTYTVTGGVPPYGPITVLSGTFPPGVTLNTDGSYSGDFTTGGDYSWTVGGEDADGNPFSVPDTSVVGDVSTLYDQVSYTGDGTSSRQIPTTVDLSEGGLVIIMRDTLGAGALYSLDGATTKKINLSGTTAENETSANAFGDGYFELNGEEVAPRTRLLNATGGVYTAHVFKKAPRCCDIVEYTGTGASNTIAHGLAVDPGMIILQETATASPSYVSYMKTLGTSKGFGFWATTAPSSDGTFTPLASTPTTNDFTLSAGAFQNGVGESFLAILFGDDSEPDGIIRNVTWTGSGDVQQVTDTGWQPQTLFGRGDAASNALRFMGDDYNADFVGNEKQVYPNSTIPADTSTDVVGLVTDGFQLNDATVWNTDTVVYHAIALRTP